MSCGKIMVITPHTPSLIWFRIDMMLDFKKRGYKVIAIGEESETQWKEIFENYGIEYRAIPIVRNGLNPFADLITIKSIKKLYKEIKPQKVFLYQAKAVVYGSIAAKFNSKIETYSLISGLGSIFRGTSYKSRILKIIMKWEYRYALRSNHAVIFHNRDDMKQFVNWKIVAETACKVVHGSGVNMERFPYADVPEEPTAFLMISRIIRDKGVIEYLKAYRLIKQNYPNVKCMLVGAFDTNPSAIQKKELEPYIPYIEYYGEQEDVRPFIRKCSTYVLPSYHEGMPKSVLEAMSMGRAIITTDVPGCRETVADGENGFIVEAKNVRQLADKMEFMIKHPELQKTMGRRSWEYVKEKFEISKVDEEIAKIMNLRQECR